MNAAVLVKDQKEYIDFMGLCVCKFPVRASENWQSSRKRLHLRMLTFISKYDAAISIEIKYIIHVMKNERNAV